MLENDSHSDKAEGGHHALPPPPLRTPLRVRYWVAGAGGWWLVRAGVLYWYLVIEDRDG